MGRKGRTAALAAGLTLLAACGGGEDGATRLGADGGGSLTANPDEIVVRYDEDHDALLDVVTLDVSQDPCVIVEALQGTADGDWVDATATWRGRTIDSRLSDALRLYRASSFSVASETELEVLLGQEPITVTVIE